MRESVAGFSGSESLPRLPSKYSCLRAQLGGGPASKLTCETVGRPPVPPGCWLETSFPGHMGCSLGLHRT